MLLAMSRQNKNGHFQLSVQSTGCNCVEALQTGERHVGTTALGLLAKAGKLTRSRGSITQNLVILPGNEILEGAKRTNRALYALARKYGYRTVSPTTAALVFLQSTDSQLHRECFEYIACLVAPSSGLYIGWNLAGVRRLGASVPDVSTKQPTNPAWGSGVGFVFGT